MSFVIPNYVFIVIITLNHNHTFNIFHHFCMRGAYYQRDLLQIGGNCPLSKNSEWASIVLGYVLKSMLFAVATDGIFSTG